MIGFNLVMLWLLEVPLVSFLIAPDWPPARSSEASSGSPAARTPRCQRAHPVRRTDDHQGHHRADLTPGNRPGDGYPPDLETVMRRRVACVGASADATGGRFESPCVEAHQDDVLGWHLYLRYLLQRGVGSTIDEVGRHQRLPHAPVFTRYHVAGAGNLPYARRSRAHQTRIRRHAAATRRSVRSRPITSSTAADGDDVRDMGGDRRGHHVGRPTPRRRRSSEQREQGQGRAHQGASEDGAGPRLAQPAVQQSVPDAERPSGSSNPVPARSRCPPCRSPCPGARSRRRFLPGTKRVAVAELPAVVAPEPSLGLVGERHRSGSGGASEDAADRPGIVERVMFPPGLVLNVEAVCREPSAVPRSFRRRFRSL